MLRSTRPSTSARAAAAVCDPSSRFRPLMSRAAQRADRARAARPARVGSSDAGQLALGAGLLGAPAHPHGVGRTRGQLTHDLAQSTGG